MARDHSGSATLSPEELEASERAGRKRLGENGHPEDRQPSAKSSVENKPSVTVSENEEPGLIDSMKGM